MEMDFGPFGRFGRWTAVPKIFEGIAHKFAEADFTSKSLLRRCASCPPNPPPCPACGDGEVCSLIGGGCDTCPVTLCQKVSAAASATPTPSSNGASSPAGPIAGGVIGGIVFVCLVTFLSWRFCIRKRYRARREQRFEEWPESIPYDEKDATESVVTPRERPDSVRSARSIASTVFTRASNVIQIAYIPGVTNRSVDSTPDLIPPVPPLPALSPVHSMSNTPNPQQQDQHDQHYFMPSDLRGSTYSDYTVDRTSYARSSVAPSTTRGSVPSTAYRESAIVHTQPAQTAIRGKANAVAVKSNGKNSPVDTPRSQTPPVPAVDRARYGLPAQNIQQNIQSNTTSPIIARLGVPKAVTVTKPTSQGNLRAAAATAKTATPPRLTESPPAAAQERKPSLTDSRHNGDSSTFDDASSDDEDSTADRSLMGHEKVPQFIKSSPNHPNFTAPNSAPDLHHPPPSNYSVSPLSASPDSHSAKFSYRDRKHRHKRSGSLNQIIEEAAKKASKEPRHGGLGSIGSIQGDWKRELRGRSREGPFDDSNAAGTP